MNELWRYLENLKYYLSSIDVTTRCGLSLFLHSVKNQLREIEMSRFICAKKDHGKPARPRPRMAYAPTRGVIHLLCYRLQVFCYRSTTRDLFGTLTALVFYARLSILEGVDGYERHRTLQNCSRRIENYCGGKKEFVFTS